MKNGEFVQGQVVRTAKEETSGKIAERAGFEEIRSRVLMSTPKCEMTMLDRRP